MYYTKLMYNYDIFLNKQKLKIKPNSILVKAKNIKRTDTIFIFQIFSHY